MELYGLDEDIVRHEVALEELVGPDRLPSSVALARYLRQRDCARAQALVEESGRWLGAADEHPLMRADAALYRAKGKGRNRVVADTASRSAA
jgi:hypothetical protein